MELPGLRKRPKVILLVVGRLLAVHETLNLVKQALATFRLRVGTAVDKAQQPLVGQAYLMYLVAYLHIFLEVWRYDL